MEYGMRLATDLQQIFGYFPVTIDFKLLTDTAKLIITWPRDESGESAREFYNTLAREMALNTKKVLPLDANDVIVYLETEDLPLALIEVKQTKDEREITFWYVPMADDENGDALK